MRPLSALTRCVYAEMAPTTRDVQLCNLGADNRDIRTTIHSRVPASMQRKALISLLLLLTLGVTTPALGGGPIWVFDQYQQAANFDEAKTYLSLSYRQSLEARFGPKELSAEFERDRMLAYAAKLHGLSDDRALLVTSNTQLSSEYWQQLPEGKRAQLRFGYEFVRRDGKWLIDKRFEPDAIILDLLEKEVTPQQFASSNLFAMGQQVLVTRSAFAYWFNEDTVWIDFYRDPLNRDHIQSLAYGRKAQTPWNPAALDAAEPRDGESPPQPYVRVTVTVDAHRHPTAWSLGYANFAGQPLIAESVSQMSPEQITIIALEGRRLRLNGDGILPGETVTTAESEQPSSFLWRLDVDLEVLETGL